MIFAENYINPFKQVSPPGLFVRSRNFLNTSILIIFSGFLSNSCHKEKINYQIKDVTGFTWKVHAVQQVNDMIINPVPTNWDLNLNSDQSFSFRFGNTVCNGTYSWAVIDTTVAAVKFTIKVWNDPTQSPGMSDKLKTILPSADKCYLYRPPFSGQYPGPPPGATMVLQFQGSQGFFSVYR
jgi:hypothetical protein